jgi:hypothetical protein
MAKPFGKQACSGRETISQKTVKASFLEGSRTRQWLDSLEDDQWSITSFDPDTATVCAAVETTHGTNHISLTLPTLVNTD